MIPSEAREVSWNLSGASPEERAEQIVCGDPRRARQNALHELDGDEDERHCFSVPMHRLTIVLADGDHEKLARLAVKDDRSLSATVRKLIRAASDATLGPDAPLVLQPGSEGQR